MRLAWLVSLAHASGRRDLAEAYLMELLSHEAFGARRRVWS